MRIDVPILHPLDPIHAPVPVLEGFVDVAALVVVVLHVRIHFTANIGHGSREEPLDNVRADVVEVIAVVVNGAGEVIHVHDLGTRLGAPVLVQQWMEGGRTGNRHDGLQVLAAHGGRFPLRGAFVGLPVQADVAVGPRLLTEPLHGGVDAQALTGPSVIETTAAFLGAEHGDLRQGVTVGHVIIEDEFATPRTDDVGGRGFRALRPVGIVGRNHGDHRHLLAGLDVGRQPVGKVHFGGWRSGFPDVRCVDFDEGFLDGKSGVRAVLQHPAVGAGPVPLDEVPVLQPKPAVVDGRVITCGFVQTSRQRHAEHEQGQHHRMPSHNSASTLPFITLTPSPIRRQGHA